MILNIHEILKEVFWTLGYILIAIILPYIRFIAQKSSLFPVFLIYKNSKKIINNNVFKNMTYLYTANMPSRIGSIGKKLLFIDILKVEVQYMSDAFKQYFENITYVNYKKHKRIYKLLKNYKYYDSMNLSMDIMNIVTEAKALIPGMVIIDIYPHIEVKRSEIIKYIKQNKETLDLHEEEISLIRQEIQIAKARRIVGKYDELMLVYRNQLSSNILTQFNSEKNVYDMLTDTLSNSILTVYINMRDTIDIGINKLNGDLDGIIYKGNEI